MPKSPLVDSPPPSEEPGKQTMGFSRATTEGFLGASISQARANSIMETVVIYFAVSVWETHLFFGFHWKIQFVAERLEYGQGSPSSLAEVYGCSSAPILES